MLLLGELEAFTCLSYAQNQCELEMLFHPTWRLYKERREQAGICVTRVRHLLISIPRFVSASFFAHLCSLSQRHC